ncbi:hypothetical protein ABGB07_32730 [Micromonosporaceae bacterium B7E4]
MTSKLSPPTFLLARPTRRRVLTAGLAGAGMLAAGITGHVRAAHAAPPGRRALGRTGERLPAIGLALTSLDLRPEAANHWRMEPISCLTNQWSMSTPDPALHDREQNRREDR